jgi:predicted ATP-dependent endonuclease of OLD family
MKICKIIIKDFQQFKDFELDLTHPETGEPLDKVCFIGSNGTGKSTLLKDLNDLICVQNLMNSSGPEKDFRRHFKIVYLVKEDGKHFYESVYKLAPNNNGDYKIAFSEKVFELYNGEESIINNPNYKFQFSDEKGFTFENNTNDLAIYVPSEQNDNVFNNINDVPTTSLNEALKLFKDFPFKHEVSSNTISQFWTLLIYLIKNRESEMIKLQEKPENQDKTIKQLKDELDKIHPKILEGLADIWNKILAKAGLEFDVEKASTPVQLTENLQAYIKLINSDTKIPYNQLSSGIRNFIFKVGHIYSLYFNRNIERGFLLIDEPENSLYPDFLYDLIEIYQNIIQNTQMFIATHSDILAAQFEPYERFILEFDEHGYVQARRGTAPIGDDPNDILYKDFQVKNLMGKKGIEKWERYIELKTRIPRTENKVEKKKLISEFMKIGNEYNFTPDYAISEQTN